MKSLARKNLNLLLDLEEEMAQAIQPERKTKRLQNLLKKLHALNRAGLHEQQLEKRAEQ
jgi:hypothetical protein